MEAFLEGMREGLEDEILHYRLEKAAKSLTKSFAVRSLKLLVYYECCITLCYPHIVSQVYILPTVPLIRFTSGGVYESALLIQQITSMLGLSLLPIIFATASARSSFFNLGNQVALGSQIPVPGKNPLYFCQNPDGYSLAIDEVDLTPNPPIP